jgi:DNA-binding protein HU-beta
MIIIGQLPVKLTTFPLRDNSMHYRVIHLQAVQLTYVFYLGRFGNICNLTALRLKLNASGSFTLPVQSLNETIVATYTSEYRIQEFSSFVSNKCSYKRLEENYLNKADLVSAVAEKADILKKDADKVVTEVFNIIEETLAANEKVTLVGFGTFEVRERAERLGRNPQTREIITIPASKAPVFKAGKGLKDAIKI